MTNNLKICVLGIALVCSLPQAAQGQETGLVQPPPSTIVQNPRSGVGAPSESDVATANNPIAPMNAVYFQNYYAPTVYGSAGPGNLLDL
jgi:hypothetical protein